MAKPPSKKGSGNKSSSKKSSKGKAFPNITSRTIRTSFSGNPIEMAKFNAAVDASGGSASDLIHEMLIFYIDNNGGTDAPPPTAFGDDIKDIKLSLSKLLKHQAPAKIDPKSTADGDVAKKLDELHKMLSPFIKAVERELPERDNLSDQSGLIYSLPALEAMLKVCELLSDLAEKGQFEVVMGRAMKKTTAP